MAIRLLSNENIDGNLTINGTGTANAPTLAVDTTSSSVFNHAIEAFNGNLTANEGNYIFVGKEGSTKNTGYIGYKYSGTSGSNANILTFGHWASDNLMNLTGDGNLGIGTESPRSITNHTSLTINGTSVGRVDLATSDTIYASFYAVSSQVGLQTEADIPLIFGTGTNSTERMRIDSSGKILLNNTNYNFIGTNTSDGSNTQRIYIGAGNDATANQGGLISVYGNEQTSTSEQGQVSLIAGRKATGNIRFWTGEASSVERMRIDSSGYVTIGDLASAPTSTTPLTVFRSGVNANFALQSGGGSGRKYIFISSTSGNLAIYDNNAGSDRLVIDSSGDVGIGTDSPTTKLEVNTNTNNDGITLNGSSDNLRFNIKNDQVTSGKRAFSMMVSGSYPALIFQGLNDAYGFTRNIMTIEHDGNVGIGTLTPSSTLSVNGDGEFRSNSSSRVLYLRQNATNAGNIIQFLDQNGSNIWELVGRNNQFYIFNNALNTYAMYINPSNNNIGIGTNNTGNKLNVPGTINLHSLGFVDVDPLNSSSGGIWSKIGTWATGQGGRNLSLKLAAGQGYNASLSQNGELHLELRTSNGAATAPNISGRWWIEGQALFVTNVRVKEVSTSEYEVYIQHNNFIGAGNIQVDIGDFDNWDSDISYNTGVPTGTLLNPSQINYFRGDQYAINSNFITTGNLCVDTTSPTHALTIDRSGGGIDLRGGNNRIYFTANRAMEGASNGTLLQIGESYSNVALYGNVGIGTTSPTTTLSVQGTTNNGINVIGVGTTATRVYAGLNSSNHGYLFATGSSGQSPSLINSAGGNSYISGGNVGIGTSSPNIKLHVNSSTINTVAKFESTDATATIVCVDSGGNVEFGASGDSFIIQPSGGSIKLQLNSSGTLTVSGDVVAYGSPSDKRLKENIKPVTNALDKVSKLQGVTFDWKESESILDIKEDIGFIAQDVQEVLPELVRENEDGKLSLRDKGIVPILVEAIKELKAEIEELKKSK